MHSKTSVQFKGPYLLFKLYNVIKNIFVITNINYKQIKLSKLFVIYYKHFKIHTLYQIYNIKHIFKRSRYFISNFKSPQNNMEIIAV